MFARCLLVVCASALLPACKPARKPVVVFAAASLARVFSDLEEVFERRHPEIDVQLELTGSQTAARKVAELGRRADVVGSADAQVIDRILRPAHTAFTLRFATNALVLAHLEHSKHTEVITAANWPEVLLRPGVRLGLVDPDLAPIGYRTLLLLELAQKHFPQIAGLSRRLQAHCAQEHRQPHELELLKLLQTRAIDYAFVYRSTAEEHNLKVVVLPASYNLGVAVKAADYAQAQISVRMAGGKRSALRGAPVYYGLTIPKTAPNVEGATAFVRLLLGVDGARILRRSGFSPLVPARCAERDALPPALRELTR